MTNKLKVLVTGSRGFIGLHTTRALNLAGYDVYYYDIENKETDLIDYVNKVDFIIHLAGINRPLSVEEFYDGNTNFTKKLVDLVKATNKQIPIIMSSSIQAALDNDYGKSKKMGEDYLFESGLPVYIFRLANVFGKWCRPNYNSAAATFMDNIAQNRPIEIRDRNYIVHYNYVGDIVETFLKCVAGEIKPSIEILSVNPVYDCSLGQLADTLYRFKQSVESEEHLPLIASPFEYKLFITFLDYLKSPHYGYNIAFDNRGSFEEIYKNDKYGQISINKSFVGITKGGHYHTYKDEIFMTIQGECITRQRKIGESEIEEYHTFGKDSIKVIIKPGFTHDITNVGKEESITLMWISEPYSDETADTFKESVDL